MRIRRTIAYASMSIGALAFSVAGIASAHVVVKPSDVKTGTFQTFNVSVPTEKDNPTVSIKLEVPEDISSARPSVKAGWTIKTDKEGTGEDAKITAITWSGGEIGAGYRDDFTFSAKTPDHPMDIEWKVHQTYQDGTVVSWDQPSGSDTDSEDSTTGPFSVTKVVTESDQDMALKAADAKAVSAGQAASTALYVGIGGIVLTVITMIILMVRKPKSTVSQQ